MFSFTVVSNGACSALVMSFDNDLRVLADPTWNGADASDILFFEQHLRDVDMILLSHSTPQFIGGFVLLAIKFPALLATIPVYATLPVSQLGRISTVEYYRANGVLGPLASAVMEVSDVDDVFDKVKPLKFAQTLSLLDGKLVLTPYNAGHTLGGTFWLLTKRVEKVIYAPSWNHSKDSFLNSAGFLSQTTGNPLASLLRPTALITKTDIGSAMSHKKRTEKFFLLVDGTLANGGAVLLPTTLSGRFFEILHLIDEHLQSAPIPVYFLSYSGTKVLSYASNLVEWMSSQLAREYQDLTLTSENGNANPRLPFDSTKVDLLGDPNELVQLAGPKIVFASGVDLRNGDMSTEALQYLCRDEKTTIILTEKSSMTTSINATLYAEWFTLASAKGKPEDGVPVPLEKVFDLQDWKREEPLSAAELAEFKQKVNNQRKLKLLARVREKKNENLLNDEYSSSDSSSSDEEEQEEQAQQSVERAAAAAAEAKESVPTIVEAPEPVITTEFINDQVKALLETNSPIDLRITHKLKPRQAMFPYVNANAKRKFDDYGEIIDLKHYTKAEDPSNANLIMESKKKFEENKKWGDDRRKKFKTPKLLPQEALNQQVLKKNLDTLFQPRKRVVESNQIKARCGLSFIDLSGLVDLRSMTLIVSALKPFNLVLMPGQSEDDLSAVKAEFDLQQQEQVREQTKKALFSSLRFSLANLRNGMSNQNDAAAAAMTVKTADANVVVELGSAHTGVGLHDFEVKLDDDLVRQVKWQKISGSYSVAQVYGQIEMKNIVKPRESAADYITPATEFTLKYLLKQDYLKQLPNHEHQTGPRLAIGNIRLPELKKKLIGKNLSAEFKSEGTLVVNNAVAVRKVTYGGGLDDDLGDIVIDGQIGPLYYTVKESIREMLAYI